MLAVLTAKQRARRARTYTGLSQRQRGARSAYHDVSSCDRGNTAEDDQQTTTSARGVPEATGGNVSTGASRLQPTKSVRPPLSHAREDASNGRKTESTAAAAAAAQGGRVAA